MTANGPLSVPNLRFREALDAVRDELATIERTDFIPINIDIPAATMTALGCMPQLGSFRERVALLPEFDVSRYDKLETYALAAGQAHAQFLAASAPVEPVQDIFDELTKLRELLVSDVTALAKRKLLDGARLGELQGPVGYKNVAFDVLLLCAMLRDHWSKVVGRTGVQASELDRAEVLADRLATAVALRDQGAAATSAAGELRHRAFTRFVETYDQARRAITYLRWVEMDGDSLVPSLYGGRTRRPKEHGSSDGAPKASAAAAENGSGAHTPPGTPTAGAANTPSAPADAHATGMPGDEPFSP